MAHSSQAPVRFGLGANWQQFALLLLVNAFVGAMVELERTVAALIGEDFVGIVSRTVVLSGLAVARRMVETLPQRR